MARLADKVAIVTGGSRGIGGATVERFVKEGAKVAIFDVLKDEGEALAEKLRGKGYDVVYRTVDITNEREVADAARAEAGCVEYHLHVSNDNPNLFIFYENWQSRPELDAHLNKPLLTAFFKRRMDLLEKDVEMHFVTMDSPYNKLSDARREDASASR